jgi:ABC-type dipeptide/oligopeptide/nickel transport system permease component
MFITFVMIRLVPGDPVEARRGERGISPERHAELLHEMGLDQPLHIRLWRFFSNVASGNLGIDIVSGRSVASMIAAVWSSIPFSIARMSPAGTQRKPATSGPSAACDSNRPLAERHARV